MGRSEEVTDYIGDLCSELSGLAAQHRLHTLQYLLRLAALEASGDQSEKLISAPPVGTAGYWDWDLKRDRVYADTQLATLFNLDPAQARRGTPLDRWLKAIHPQDVDEVLSKIRTSVDSGHEYVASYRLVSLRGEIRYVMAQGRCLYDAKGKPFRFPGVLREQAKPELIKADAA